MAAKTKNGLPRKAFAFAPSADPSTWKLPFLTAEGKPDPDALPVAAEKLGEAGVPSDMIPAVKARLRQAYRRWKGTDVTYPDGIAERSITGEDGMEVREATVLLDRGSCYARVVFAPNGDALVIPDYDGAFYYASLPWDRPSPSPAVTDANWDAKWNAQDAADVLKRLISLKGTEVDEPDDMAVLDKAIAAVSTFIKNESDEIGAAPTTENVEAAIAYVLGAPDDVREAAFAEAGKRNSGKDQARIQGMHDLAHDLGASHEKGKTYAGMSEAMSEGVAVDGPPAVEHLIETTDASGAPVTFRESSYDSATVVDLREADPIWTDDGKSVWITPIRPGFGNTRDNFFYPAGTIREATEAGMFNGLKMYKDHPRLSDKKELPERSIERWFATTKESVWDERRQLPRVRVAVHEEADRARFKEAPEQIAFSIIGGGHAKPGRVDGRDTRVVEAFTNVNSVDWVTEAGAGGALDFAESAAGVPKELDMKNVDIEKLTAAQLKEANPDLFAAVLAEGAATDDAPADDQPADDGKPAEGAAPVAESGEVVPAWAQRILAIAESQEKATADAAKATALAESKATVTSIVEAAVGESTLIGKGKDHVKALFSGKTLGEGGDFATEESLKAAVSESLNSAQAFAAALLGKPAGVTGLGGAPEPTDGDAKKAIVAEAAARYGKDAVPPKPKLVWAPGEAMGDDFGRAQVIGGSGIDGPITESGDSAGEKPADELAAAFAAL